MANSLSAMAIADRSTPDFELLAETPDGVIHLDLVKVSATHDKVGVINLEATARLADWLRARLDALSIPMTTMAIAGVRVEYRTDRVRTYRAKVVSFDWRSEAILSTDEREYRGQVVQQHMWYSRRSAV